MILVQLSYLGQLQAAQGGVTPVPSAVNVTSTLTTLAAASAGARKVQVFNNGSNDVTILEGGTPVAGTTGFVLKPGGYYESPSSHFAVVNAICGATLSSQVTVVTLGQ